MAEKDEKPPIFAIQVAKFRKRRGLTQAKLGQLCGLAPSTISDIETGRSESSSEIDIIAKALEVDAIALRIETEDEHPSPTAIPQTSEEETLLALFRNLPTENDRLAVIGSLTMKLKPSTTQLGKIEPSSERSATNAKVTRSRNSG